MRVTLETSFTHDAVEAVLKVGDIEVRVTPQEVALLMYDCMCVAQECREHRRKAFAAKQMELAL